MGWSPVIALVDGEHQPGAVRTALDALDRDRGVAGVVFCGGEEKVRPEVLEQPQEHYGRPVAGVVGTSVRDPTSELRRLAADTNARAVIDLGDEPVLRPPARFALAALALDLGLRYEAPGLELAPPPSDEVPFGGRKLAVIGTGKRTGKTAVAGHWAGLLRDRGERPVIVSMGRGGPDEPRVAGAETTLEDLVRISAEGGHAASDYLEDAVLARVPAVGCRRIGGGLAGEPWTSNVAEAAALAASLSPDVLLFEGSGACIPPVAVDRTVCVVGDRAGALEFLGPLRLLRSQLALVTTLDAGLVEEVARVCPGRVLATALRLEPAEPLPGGARVAFFSTGADEVAGVEPVVSSRNLARRPALERDLDRAARERCDVYLTELKAAAIDTVAARARREGAQVAFARNRPVGLEEDLDAALLELAPRG